MKNILKNNPNYYIDGGKETNCTNIEMINLLNKGLSFNIKKFPENNSGIIEIIEGNNCIGWISFMEDKKYYTIIVSSIKDNFQGKGYGKQIYLKLAFDAKRNNKKLISQEIHNLNKHARYIWNSFVFNGIAEFNDKGMYFEFL